MIGRLTGLLLEKQPPEVLLEVNGIGYEIFMPMSCFYELPDLGDHVTLFTHFVVREDAQLLYGFNSRQARSLFRELIKVNGVGPKLALAILSGMSAQQFVRAVEHEEISALVNLPGVGKKTAERLVVEMKDRLQRLSGDFFAAQKRVPQANIEAMPEKIASESEAVSALLALGYRPAEASRMVSRVMKEGADSETLIREALRATL